MPKPLDEWLWKAMREWRMPGVAQLRYGQWHRGEPDEFAECGTYLPSSYITTSAGKGSKYRNPFSSKPLRNGELCKKCFADEIPMVEAVWLALFGPSKGYTPPQGKEREWVRY
jgi:hypothetical protein